MNARFNRAMKGEPFRRTKERHARELIGVTSAYTRNGVRYVVVTMCDGESSNVMFDGSAELLAACFEQNVFCLA